MIFVPLRLPLKIREELCFKLCAHIFALRQLWGTRREFTIVRYRAGMESG
jgi:hypothetical protein